MSGLLDVRLAYGSDGLRVDLPDAGTTVVEPRYRPGLADPLDALRHALRHPIGSPALRDVVRPGARIAISVCDKTRPQPRELMLRAILDELDGIARPGDVTVLIASGSHEGNTPSELVELLGSDVVASCEVRTHLATDRSSLVSIGILGNGVPTSLARGWLDADVRITTGFVEPHFFAGFSGGPKMVAPGLAGLETILRLHDGARIGHPMARWGVIEGNPVHDDVRAIARATGVHFALDVTLNRDKQITRVFAGALELEHRAACEAAREDAMRRVPDRFDVVVTTNSGYPLDRNLYQTIKGISAAAQVVADGGTIVCASECRDGMPDHGMYAELLASAASPAELLARIEGSQDVVPDQWQVQIQARIQLRARVLVKVAGLTDAQVIAAHLEPIDDVGSAVRSALRRAGPAARLCVLPEGPQTIPYVG